MKTIFLTTKDHLDIVKEEIEQLCKCKVDEVAIGIFQAEPKKIVPAKIFGFVKEVGVLKKTFSREHYLEELKSSDIENAYKIRTLSLDNTIKTKQVADDVHKLLDTPVVNLENPNHEYLFLFLEKAVHLIEITDKNTDSPEERKSHKKTHNHPTSLDPKLAKAMINIGGEDTFHDPFCGVGGIVIEGALQGVNASGSDISLELIEKSRENAKKYGLEINVFEKDALLLDNKYPVIVTDLPYGRNSTLTKEIPSLYTEFFQRAQLLTKKLVVGMMEGTSHDDLLQRTSWKVEKQFIIYVHKSLSRKILVLSI